MEQSQCKEGLSFDRSETLCEKDSRQAYFDLLNSHLYWLFPEFVRNLQSQSPHAREMSRTAVLEYKDTSQCEQMVFKGSKELQYYLERSASDKTRPPQQRLFLLEDLSLNSIEVLGSQLRIPPSFFGAHWADPTTPTFNYRNPFCRYSKDGFIIRYPSTQPLHISAPPGQQNTIYRFNSNVNRHVHSYDPKGPIIDQPKSYHALSFWTSDVREDGSWDSVLIVDPPVGGFVKSLPDGILLTVDHHSNEHAYVRMHSLAPDFNDVKVLSPDTSDWNQGWLNPQYHSMFDDILAVTHAVQHRALHPRACTEIARKLVISTFLTFLRRRILNMLKLQADPHAPALYVNRCDYLRQFGHGMLSSWHHELFGFVVNVKYIMGIMAKEAEDNVVALGLNHTLTKESDTVPQWEKDGWISIQEHCAKIIAMADAFLRSYLQFTSMQEAQAANKNARSLARITNLTMVFIPLSTVAAIFSMTDDFSPGQGKSWIFWAVALPILLVMFIFTTESRSVLKQYWVSCHTRQDNQDKATHVP